MPGKKSKGTRSKTSLVISTGKSTASSATSSPTTARTPADEGIAFFESDTASGDVPIRVWELPLEPDGGPSKDREVRKACPA